MMLKRKKQRSDMELYAEICEGARTPILVSRLAQRIGLSWDRTLKKSIHLWRKGFLNINVFWVNDVERQKVWCSRLGLEYLETFNKLKDLLS